VPKKPLDELEAGRAFYAERLPQLDGEYFGTMWHLFTVGHLVTTDLDRIAGTFGFSYADLHLLGMLSIERRRAMRATDLASALYVSNAVLSIRIARLEKLGLLTRDRSGVDRRAYELTLTERGRAIVEESILVIAGEAKIVRHFRKLPPEDRQSLSRLLGKLHEMMDREFVGVQREND